MPLNRPDIFVGVAFNADPFDQAVTPVWSDLTARCTQIGSATRGRNYELDRNQNGSLEATWFNADEALNPANTGSPYSPNVVPYRQILARAQWPNGGTGNLLNLLYNNTDGSFESYANGGAAPTWLTRVGSVVPTITTTTPQQGTQCVTYPVTGGATVRGLSWTVPCIPGRLYITSAYVRQTSASTQQISVAGLIATGNSTTTTGAYVRLAVAFYATQPTHVVQLATTGTAVAGTAFIDAIQHEQTAPLNVNPFFEPPLLASSWQAVNGAVLDASSTQAHEGSFSLRVTPDGVSAVPQAQSEEIACVAGQLVAVYGWLRSAASGTRTLNLFWFDAAHASLSSSPISQALSGGVWTQYGATTFTAPASAAFFRIVTNDPGTPSAANTWRGDQLLAASPTAFTTTGPLIRNIWTRGYVERWPAQWDDNGFRGVSSTPCVGPFAILNNADLHTEMAGAILAKAPSYYWRLGESSGATAYADSSGNNGAPLLVWASSAGPGTPLAPGSAIAIAGDPSGTGVAFTQGVAAGGSSVVGSMLGTGPLFRTPAVSFPASATGSSWGASWAMWAQITYPLNGTCVLFKAVDLSGVIYPCWMSANTDGSLSAIFDTYGGSASVGGAASGAIVNDGKPHLIVGTISQVVAGNTVMNLYVDGNLYATSTTATGLMTVPVSSVMVGGRFDGLDTRAIIGGVINHVALYPRVLSPSEVADLSTAGKGYAGEDEGVRIARQLAAGGYNGPSTVQAGASVMGPSTVKEGDAVLAACQQSADSAFGNFFEDANGVAYASRNDRYLKTSASFVFGERVDLGEYPYEDDITFDFDPQLVLNLADVTRSGGIKAHAEDTTGASQKRYGKKNFTRTIDIASDNETIDAATYVVSNRKDPLQRISAVTFNPATVRNLPFGDGTLWPMLLTLEIGTRITAKRRPKAANAGAGIVMSGDFFVEAINHHDIDFEAGTWLTTLLLSPVNRAQPWILEHATYGVLDSTTVLGF